MSLCHGPCVTAEVVATTKVPSVVSETGTGRGEPGAGESCSGSQSNDPADRGEIHIVW